jgi:hypothetical protein
LTDVREEISGCQEELPTTATFRLAGWKKGAKIIIIIISRGSSTAGQVTLNSLKKRKVY